MDPAPNTVEIDAIDSLFADLLQASDSDGVVNKSRVYACLLGRTTPFLITRFCHVEDHLWRSREERVGLGFEVATRDAWKELCMQAIHKGYHVLERLLVRRERPSGAPYSFTSVSRLLAWIWFARVNSMSWLRYLYVTSSDR